MEYKETLLFKMGEICVDNIGRIRGENQSGVKNKAS